jgi:L-2-hydroxycarboxylate dehydrogenase (NAD+)
VSSGSTTEPAVTDPAGTTGVTRVDAAHHLVLTVTVLRSLGTPERAAREQAELLLEGDLRGHPSHGLRRLDILVQRIRNGVIRPAVEPVLEWSTDSVLRVDGRMGLGPPTGRRAVAALLDRVRRTGTAVAAVREANHLGMLAPYVETMAEQGVIGIALTTSEALVHPWGGRLAMVGTNPLAVAIPTGGGPVVLDMATGQISRGKVLEHAARGLPLAPGDAVDADGAPTTDATAAVDGAISPFGGPKGYALGLTLELLVASLTSSALGRDVQGTLDGTMPVNKGDLFIALDVDAFGGGVSGAMATYLHALRNTPLGPGHERVTIPGDRARSTRELNLRSGVPVADVTWQRAHQIAEEIGVLTPTEAEK